MKKKALEMYFFCPMRFVRMKKKREEENPTKIKDKEYEIINEDINVKHQLRLIHEK